MNVDRMMMRFADGMVIVSLALAHTSHPCGYC